MKTAILLINLGTPASPSVKDVRSYLTEFLNDPYVMDMSAWKRFILVNFMIVPARAKKSSETYRQIWTENGSPLLHHSRQLQSLVQNELGTEFIVAMAMRYGKPSLAEVIEGLRQHHPSKIILFPLYPQYADSTTRSSLEAAIKLINLWSKKPEVTVINKFYDQPSFICSWVTRARKYDIASYDHVLFSFHGLPESHLVKGHHGQTCEQFNCIKEITPDNRFCYRAACYETARQISKHLNLSPSHHIQGKNPSSPLRGEKGGPYSISFQSRLGKNIWMQPYTDATVRLLAEKGVKRLLVFCPSFIADCLETLYEIGVEMNHLFKQHGGKELTLVESLNELPVWVRGVKEIIFR